MKQLNFDPFCALRALTEMLFSAGLSAEALHMARRIDEAQLEAWQEQPQKSAASG